MLDAHLYLPSQGFALVMTSKCSASTGMPVENYDVYMLTHFATILSNGCTVSLPFTKAARIKA